MPPNAFLQLPIPSHVIFGFVGRLIRYLNELDVNRELLVELAKVMRKTGGRIEYSPTVMRRMNECLDADEKLAVKSSETAAYTLLSEITKEHIVAFKRIHPLDLGDMANSASQERREILKI